MATTITNYNHKMEIEESDQIRSNSSTSIYNDPPTITKEPLTSNDVGTSAVTGIDVDAKAASSLLLNSSSTTSTTSTTSHQLANLAFSPSSFETANANQLLKNPPLSALKKKRPREEVDYHAAVQQQPPHKKQTTTTTKKQKMKKTNSKSNLTLPIEVDLDELHSSFEHFHALYRPVEVAMGNDKTNLLRISPDLKHKTATKYISAVFHDGPLGLVFQPCFGREDLFCVEDIVPDSQVEHKHCIQIGDLISSVNNTILHGKSFEEVYSLLKLTPRPITIRFTRGDSAYPPLPPPPRQLSELPVPGLNGFKILPSSKEIKTMMCQGINMSTLCSRNKRFIAVQAGPFAKLVNVNLKELK